MSEKVPEKKKRGSSLKKLLQNSFFGSSTSKDKKRHETAVVPNAARVKTKSVPGSYQGHDPHCGDSYHFNRKLGIKGLSFFIVQHVYRQFRSPVHNLFQPLNCKRYLLKN